MKPPENYRITALRVVEFHNLGTTEIRLPEGGHLFLLGDNGSGKTTILDAIHLVLSAGKRMEFNSAARITGARDAGGRSIQGIVLRYNAVTGRPLREAGVSYAAVELRSTLGNVYSLVVGISARGMDVAFERWGGIAATPVADLPLTVAVEGKCRVALQSEFKEKIGTLPGGKYYGHINDYAKAIAVRFFGGEMKFFDVCKLLSTGKAYREIAARAENYDDLFRKLLEEPNRDIFEPLLKGLRELEESKGRLALIDERTSYLQALLREEQKLAKLRRNKCLTSWAEAHHEQVILLKKLEQCDVNVADKAEQIKQRNQQLAELKDAVYQTRNRLADLQAKDASGLLQQEKNALTRVERSNRKYDEVKKTLEETLRQTKDAEKQLKNATTQWRDRLSKGAKELMGKGQLAQISVSEVTDAFVAGTTAETPYAIPDYREVIDTTRKALYSEKSSQETALHNAQIAVDNAQHLVSQHRAALEELRTRSESIPNVQDFAHIRREIHAKMVTIPAVYELLEPTSGCDSHTLALLERLVGDDFLATWMVPDESADLVRRIVWQNGGAHTICVRNTITDTDVTDIAPWIGKIISFEDSDIDAIKLLAMHLTTKFGPSVGKFLSQKIWTFRGREGLLEESRPRLIGRKAREAEHRRLIQIEEAKLSEAERTHKAAKKTFVQCDERRQAIVQVIETLGRVERLVADDVKTVELSLRKHEQLQETVARLNADVQERKEECGAAQDVLDDIQLKMRAEGVDESLEKRIKTTQQRLQHCEQKEARAHADIGRLEGEKDVFERERSRLLFNLQTAKSKCEAQEDALRGELPDEMEMESFAQLHYPVCVATTEVNYEKLREDLAKEIGATEAKIEQRIRDPKGETYAFASNKETGRIVDRRGVVLEDVLKDETGRLEELREILDQKGREIFERIFMGEVMERLHHDLMRIEDLTSRIQRKLKNRQFGSNRYAFMITPIPEYDLFVKLVRERHTMSMGDERDELKEYLEHHREEILNAEVDKIPDTFDYRKWFRFELKVVTANDEGRVIDRKVKSMGSGGEQAVPNYLLILTVAEFLYHGNNSVDSPKMAPILFDEAFYGIDTARRDQLLAFADDLGLQLFISSPDQDGVKREIQHSVSLIVVKDEHLDVHLTPVIWNNQMSQGDLLGEAPVSNKITIAETL